MVKLVLISDTHGKHWSMQVPDGDILVHAGDFSMRGREDEIRDFNDWLGTMPHAHIVVSPGNHDFLFETDEARARALLPNAQVLVHEAAEVAGLKFFSSPWTPEFHHWAFNYSPTEAEGLWAAVPQGTNVLVTHGPPRCILDVVKRPQGLNVGCPVLLRAVQAIRPQLHVFGHIHEARGTMQVGGVTYVNASMLDANYEPVHLPFVFNV